MLFYLAYSELFVYCKDKRRIPIKIVLRSGILTSRRAGHFEHILKMRLFFFKTGHQAGTMNPLVMVKMSNESSSENCEMVNACLRDSD